MMEMRSVSGVGRATDHPVHLEALRRNLHAIRRIFVERIHAAKGQDSGVIIFKKESVTFMLKRFMRPMAFYTASELTKKAGKKKGKREEEQKIPEKKNLEGVLYLNSQENKKSCNG